MDAKAPEANLLATRPCGHLSQGMPSEPKKKTQREPTGPRPQTLALADYWSHPVLPSHREARKAHTGKKHKGAREELNPGPLTSRDLKDPAGTTRLQGPLSGGRL